MFYKSSIGENPVSGVTEADGSDTLVADPSNDVRDDLSPAVGVSQASYSSRQNSKSISMVAPWLASARFLLAWVPALLLGFYTKWYAMENLKGFENVAHSMGFLSLGFVQRFNFFRGDVLVGFLLIPAFLLVLDRYLVPVWAAVATALFSIAFLVLFGIQLRALDEVGRYISADMILTAVRFGLHEATGGYISLKGIAVLVAAAAMVGMLVVWAVRRCSVVLSDRAYHSWRIAGEVYVMVIVAILAMGWKSGVPTTPYHESAFVRSVVSLWRENTVDTGEFAAFDFERITRANINALPSLSTGELIAHYRALVHAPAPEHDPRYFGKESGDNVLFIVLETTPDEFLPANDDMKQFPNLARLRAKSFLATRHYTTLPMTVTAWFSAFTSWYPMDSLSGVHGFSPSEIAPDFLARLGGEGYETAVFTPLRYHDREDDDMYNAVDFRDHFSLAPNAALPTIPGYRGQPSWKAVRIGSDIVTLHMMEARMDGWIGAHQKFVAAFMPQIGHFPYPDLWPEDSTENLRDRGRAIIAREDAWIGQLMDFLAERGQLDKTIIVVFGDHGRRNVRENPNLRRGTIDETSFHVPLLIYAPRTLNHTERIPWITSHIDIVPTVLDLLGVKGNRECEQGTAIWNPDLAGRTTFFFAQPTFGADGYASKGKFYMWNYSSNVVYENSSAVFHSSDFLLSRSPIAGGVISTINTMVSLEKTWHIRFARPPSQKE